MLVAANRYRIMGKAIAAGECEGGDSALHLPDATRSPQTEPRAKTSRWGLDGGRYSSTIAR
jgi:hypothetical protein